MPPAHGLDRLARAAAWLDEWLRSVRPVWRIIVLAATLSVVLVATVRNIPRESADLSALPLLGGLQHRETAGTDTIADRYEARVILHDWRDMYAKRLTEQTSLEAATWSKEASAPYPPVVLFAEAGLLAIGQWLDVNFAAMVSLLALAFLALSLWYAVVTRWYVFPLLYLNFQYFSERFFFVQDGSYLVMLVVVMGALIAARWRSGPAHTLMALAITMKFSPLYYVRHLLQMSRPMATLFVAILAVGLVIPFAVLDNYAYIYAFNDMKGHAYSAVGAGLLAAASAIAIAKADIRLGFDWEDRIGWALVPFALFLAVKMNVARHLLIVLLVPDKRAMRNVVAAIALAVPVLLPVRFNSSLAVAIVLLFVVLLGAVKSSGVRPLERT